MRRPLVVLVVAERYTITDPVMQYLGGDTCTQPLPSSLR